DGMQTGMKMRRRIDMRPPLADMTVFVDAEAVLVDGVQGLDRLVRGALPMRNAGREGMGQIHEAMRLNDGQRIGQRARRRLIRGVRTDRRGQCRGTTGNTRNPCTHETLRQSGKVHARLTCRARRAAARARARSGRCRPAIAPPERMSLPHSSAFKRLEKSGTPSPVAWS